MSCPGKFTTYEVAAVGKMYRTNDRLVLVPIVELQKLLAAAQSLHALSSYTSNKDDENDDGRDS